MLVIQMGGRSRRAVNLGSSPNRHLLTRGSEVTMKTLKPEQIMILSGKIGFAIGCLECLELVIPDQYPNQKLAITKSIDGLKDVGKELIDLFPEK